MVGEEKNLPGKLQVSIFSDVRTGPESQSIRKGPAKEFGGGAIVQRLVDQMRRR